MLAVREKKKPLTLSRLGVFATQFIDNTRALGYSSKRPPGRSRGSVEFKSHDVRFYKVRVAAVMMKLMMMAMLTMFCTECEVIERGLARW